VLDRLAFPNPQQIRQEWLDLNGQWDCLLVENENDYIVPPAADQFDRQIQVPSSPTFPVSGLDLTTYYPVIWYRREFAADLQDQQRALLNFEAVDYECDIWLNGQHIGHHRGGHTPFTLDVTNWLAATNELIVKVVDHNRTTQPLGKQSWKDQNFLCWYTRTIGIWQNVWLEFTGEHYVTRVTALPEIHRASLNLDLELDTPAPVEVRATARYAGQLVTTATVSAKNGRAKFSLDVSDNQANFRLHYWTPATPDLYDLSLEVLDRGQVTDHIDSYFGMRGIETRGQDILVNDQRVYQKLILNQGYDRHNGLSSTVTGDAADIDKIKEMGFNGHRLHQHIGSHRLLYLCDAKGLYTWAEMPSPFEFSATMMTNFQAELPAFIAKHINHPAVITYVLMNESWGVNEIAHQPAEQAFVDGLVDLTKAYDPTRLVIGNDGWEQVKTDVATVHDYDNDPDRLTASYPDLTTTYQGSPSQTSGRRTFCDGYQEQSVPFILSEYGGIAYEEDAQSDSWGYGDRIQSKEAVVAKIEALTQAVMAIPNCAGFCYTQLSDVEQEVNGLLDHDHRYKIDPERIHAIFTAEHQTGFVFD